MTVGEYGLEQNNTRNQFMGKKRRSKMKFTEKVFNSVQLGLCICVYSVLQLKTWTTRPCATGSA